MIDGAIENVALDALRALVTHDVREGGTMECKRNMPGKAQSDIVAFLATVASPANTDGGGLLTGGRG